MFDRPASTLLTYDDLRELPQDGRRYELVEGMLVVNAAPRPLHQRAVNRLLLLLEANRPPGAEVFPAPLDWHISATTVLEPDVVVVPVGDDDDEYFEGTPLLIAEVLSPSTRLYDLGTKQLAFAEAGAPLYLVVDPDLPAVTLNRLVDGRYESTTATGTDELVLPEPFAAPVSAAALIAAPE